MEIENIKILAIDDNDDNLLTLSALIYESFPRAIMFTANSGEKGLMLAETMDPDVILLDIVMPGMDGYEVCKRLKSDSKLSEIPVVFVTALRSDKDSRIRALECGAEAFITKPLDLYELTAQIKAMVKIKTANIRKHAENELLTALVEARTRELNETHLATLNLLEDLSSENIARKKSEEALRTSERQIRTLFQTIPDMIWLKDKEGVYLACNTMFERFFNHPESEISGKTDYDFVSKEFADFFREMDRLAMEAGKPSVNEEWITFGNDGHRALLETIKTPVYGSKGELIGVLGIGRDITQRYQAEQDLIKSKEKAEESNRLKTSFLANISHEIRTPLNTILGFAEMLKEPDLSNDDIKEFVGFIEMGGKRMLSIINDLIDISKIEAGLTEISNSSYNLNEQIDDLYGFFKPEADHKNITLFVNKGLPDSDSVINSDKSKLDAILINLIKNALKFTSVGKIEIGYKKKDSLIEFYVKDTGIGIKPEKQKIIFERFRQGSESVTRSFEGSGLGLAISKAYVEMLGGDLWVESEPDKGSTFYFTIPPLTP